MLWTLDACEIADQVRSGKLSAKEILECFLERIDTHNGELTAFVHVDPERARAEAAEIDSRVSAGDDPGPLAGVPIGVKDLEHVAGMPTRFGSVPYRDNVTVDDSVEVSRLRRAGCVVVGKTATPEFGSTAHTSTPLHGTTRNPWNLERTPGGSSGGSAAAVAAGLVPIATGSDGGGSIRIPAAYSGLVGHKVTFGLVPRGSGPDSSMTSTLGPLSRSVRDAARFLDCVVGPHELDQFSLPHPGIRFEDEIKAVPRGLRATWSSDLGFGVCAREVAEIARTAADRLVAAAGLTLTRTPVELEDPGPAWSWLGRAGTYLNVSPYWDDHEQDFTTEVAGGYRRGRDELNVQRLAYAIERRWHNNRALAGVFADVDVILTPTTSTTAYGADGPMPREIDGTPLHRPIHGITFTYPFNMSGHPAVSIPCGVDAEGLPVGLQIVGRRHTDHVLLALAAAFERAHPWPKLAPAYA